MLRLSLFWWTDSGSVSSTSPVTRHPLPLSLCQSPEWTGSEWTQPAAAPAPAAPAAYLHTDGGEQQPGPPPAASCHLRRWETLKVWTDSCVPCAPGPSVPVRPVTLLSAARLCSPAPLHTGGGEEEEEEGRRRRRRRRRRWGGEKG